MLTQLLKIFTLMSWLIRYPFPVIDSLNVESPARNVQVKVQPSLLPLPLFVVLLLLVVLGRPQALGLPLPAAGAAARVPRLRDLDLIILH